MLDLTVVPDLSSKEVADLVKDGYQVDRHVLESVLPCCVCYIIHT